MYSKEQIEATLKSKGFVFFADEANKGFDVNVVGVRNNDPKLADAVTNVFDDKLTLSFKKNGKWEYREWDITTDPGTKAVKQFHNPAGVFRLMPGQYRGMWAIGLHQGKYEAMRQVKPCRGWRDKNKDMVFDETMVVEGVFGINGHRSNPKTQSEYVENWSEGCQVFKRLKDFNEFMSIMRLSRDIHGNSFTYTLLESTDIK
jgi:hypothetical protein